MQGQASSSTLTLDVVTTPGEMESLEQPWDALLEQIADPLPFCTHAWISNWWSCFGHDAQLQLLVGRRDGRICGIAPLKLDQTSLYGVPLRRLGCLYNPHVQRMAFPVLDQDKDEFHAALWQHVLTSKSAWDIVELNQFTRDSETLQAMQEHAVHAGLHYGYWTQGASPYITVAGNWEDYLTQMSAHRRRALARKMRRLGDAGELRLERVSHGDAVDAALADGFRLEGRAWKASQNTAITSQPAVQRFYIGLAQSLQRKSGLALYFLSVGGKRVAFQYCLEAGTALYLLKPGYDPVWFRYSPSEVLLRLVLEDAYVTNKTEYDLLGDTDEWKLRWTSNLRWHDWLYIFNDSLRGSLAYSLKMQVVPKVKALTGARQGDSRANPDLFSTAVKYSPIVTV